MPKQQVHSEQRQPSSIPLSQAILLGDTLKLSADDVYLSRDGACGCALGGALLAVGGESGVGVEFQLTRAWPWLESRDLTCISMMYTDVCAGARTLDSLVEWVKGREVECGVVVGGLVLNEPELAAV